MHFIWPGVWVGGGEGNKHPNNNQPYSLPQLQFQVVPNSTLRPAVPIMMSKPGRLRCLSAKIVEELLYEYLGRFSFSSSLDLETSLDLTVLLLAAQHVNFIFPQDPNHPETPKPSPGNARRLWGNPVSAVKEHE